MKLNNKKRVNCWVLNEFFLRTKFVFVMILIKRKIQRIRSGDKLLKIVETIQANGHKIINKENFKFPRGKQQ